MGYTNYWYQHRSFTDSEWKEIKSYFVHRYCNTLYEGRVDLETEITEDLIAFNGKGIEACESFILTKNLNKEPSRDGFKHFNCCKTRVYPYDKVVWKLLKFIKFVVLDPNNPNDKSFQISNDNGDRYE
tara:strand:- start:662 stop:1045 length:384 start_codon:yes stop_codon:yes gene_type:complete